MWYIILAAITVIYLILNFFIGSGSMIESYVIRPLLWICLAIITIIVANNEGLNILKFKKVRKWYLGKTPIQAGILLGGFQVALLIIIGIFFGFGKSPYQFTPFSIAINVFFVCSLLIGTEISRAYLIKRSTKSSRKNFTLFLLLITILYMFISITASQYAVLDFSDPVKALEFLGATLVTALAMNLLASYLSYLGGATASIGYMGVLLVFQWFSPILPNPHWTILALIGTIAPAIGFIVLQDSIKENFGRIRSHKRRKTESGYGWTIVAIFALIMVFFSYGFLGVEPKVIYSGSMQPILLVGDIAIIDNVDMSQIQIGDIIQIAKEGNITIIHRVIDKYEDEKGNLFFKTKGDANEDPDPNPVFYKNVLGKLVFTIPKLGWIQIYVNQLFKPITNLLGK